MALSSCYNTVSYFSSSILIIICLMMTTTTNGNRTPLEELCAETDNGRLCLEAVGGNRDASLESAAEVGFQTAGIGAITIKDIFHRIVTKPSSGSLSKELAGKCEQKYDHIFKDLVTTGHEAMRVGRWEDVKSPVNQIILADDDCEKLWNGNSPAHDDSRKVKVAAQAIVEIAKIRTQFSS